MSAHCALIAGRLGLDADVVRNASRLHDVGMLAVELPQGELTASARRGLERHPGLGHAVLSGSSSELLELAAEIALSHHERFDGAGYPRGLAGEQIPLAGRIAAVADTFDALTTDRPHRAAVTVEDAAATLRSEAGEQFDPRVVEVFVDQLDSATEILRNNPPDVTAKPAHDDDEQMTLRAAAATLHVSPSRLRRWADDGRITAVRTPGGHRRFPREDVIAFAAEQGVLPTVRPLEPPPHALPRLAVLLRGEGGRMARTAAATIYRGGPPGWFESADGLANWLSAMADSAESGQYRDAVTTSKALMRNAKAHGAGPLERHAFLERFGQVAVHALTAAGADRSEIAGTRRLIVAIQQALLHAAV